jgi:hypothetical protein
MPSGICNRTFAISYTSTEKANVHSAKSTPTTSHKLFLSPNTMSRKTRLPNTQTPEDRELWHRIKAAEAAAIREKRKRYGLRSNREARLYCAPPTRDGT